MNKKEKTQEQYNVEKDIRNNNIYENPKILKNKN